MIIGIRVLYRLFSNLLSGVLFILITRTDTFGNELLNCDGRSFFGDFDFFSSISFENYLFSIFYCYFIGLVISRFGSFVIQPVLKWIGWIKWCDPQDCFGHSEENETKLNIEFVLSSEQNNMYRTLFTLFVSILFVMLYSNIVGAVGIAWIGLFIGFMVLFFFSYRKQTNFIRKEIENNKE